jgi:hypothetical protein
MRAAPDLNRQFARIEKPMKILLKLGLVVMPLVLGASLVHPFGPVKQRSSDRPLLTGAEAPPEITRLIERACRNCHSERTEWPWYSYIAPVSWMIELHVSGGRTHMNLSRWQDYAVEQQLDLLTKITAEVRNRNMPLPGYLKLHPEARLSLEDIQQLDSWTRGERDRLKAASRKGKTGTD